MRKLSIPILLLAIIALVLTGCSKDKETTDKKIIEGKSSITGIVKENHPESVIIESRDRIVSGDVIASKRTELKDSIVDFDIGDTIIVYYDGAIAESYPAQINKVHSFELKKKAEFSEGESKDTEKDSIGFDDVDYYDMPGLSSVSNGKTKNLTESQSAFVQDLINAVEWDKGSKEGFKGDYEVIENSEVLITFNSKTHTLNDTKNDISVVLQKNMSETLKKILDNEL